MAREDGRDLEGTAAVLGAAACYATLPILVKLALAAGARIWPIVAWRFLVGTALVWIFVAATRRPLPTRRHLPALAGLGVVYAGNAIAFLVGLQYVPAATAILLFFTYPAVVVLLAAVFLGERLTGRRLGAVALVVGGCGLTAGVGLHGGSPAGLVLILASVAFVSTFILASRPVLRDLPALGGTAVLLAATAGLTTAAALLTGGLAPGGDETVPALLGLLGLVATALPVTLFLAGIQRVGAGRAAILSTVEPALTVLLAALVLGESVTAGQLVGGGLILAGVSWLRSERPLPEAEEPRGLEA